MLTSEGLTDRSLKDIVTDCPGGKSTSLKIEKDHDLL